MTSFPLILGITPQLLPGLVEDMELGVVDDDVNQGVAVGEADLQPLLGHPGGASAAG